jgi:hypothetical protein
MKNKKSLPEQRLVMCINPGIQYQQATGNFHLSLSTSVHISKPEIRNAKDIFVFLHLQNF